MKRLYSLPILLAVLAGVWVYAHATGFLSFKVHARFDDLYLIERGDELLLLGGCKNRHGTMLHLIKREDGSYDIPFVEEWTLLKTREQDDRAWGMCLELGYR